MGQLLRQLRFHLSSVMRLTRPPFRSAQSRLVPNRSSASPRQRNATGGCKRSSCRTDHLAISLGSRPGQSRGASRHCRVHTVVLVKLDQDPALDQKSSFHQRSANESWHTLGTLNGKNRQETGTRENS